jgi:signal transduction histidine kinase
VEVELRQDATSLEIVVRDSGPGVAPDLAQEVFTHGFTTKAAAEGERGLGLAMTRLICRRHAGEATVESGAFIARLSITNPPAPAPDPPTPAPASTPAADPLSPTTGRSSSATPSGGGR